jgi:transposase
MTLYAGIDLHSTNSYMVLVNQQGELAYKKRLPNDLSTILYELKRHDLIDSIVVESTYNWYWLVDGLQAANYTVRLANTNAIQQYNGLKHTNDKTDARWLAELNRLRILPEGYIYPKEARRVRDMLRKRSQLVQQRTAQLLSLQTLIERNENIRLSGNQIKQLTEEKLSTLITNKNSYLSARSNFIVMRCIEEQISLLESEILSQVKTCRHFKRLQTVDGIGKILALTILLETGDIHRFKSVGNYASYCRCVNSKRESNGKKKGENNRKNGNRYLAWAYIEAAHFAIRYNDTIKKFYQRKLKKTNAIVAIKAVAHKLARACYYMMKNEVDFDVTLSFMS